MNLRKDHCHAPAACLSPLCNRRRKGASRELYQKGPRAWLSSRGAARTTTHCEPTVLSWPRGASGPYGRPERGDSRLSLLQPPAERQGLTQRNLQYQKPQQLIFELNSRGDGHCVPNPAITSNEMTTFSNGYLGSCNDEERSEMRYVMRIAEL